MLGFAKCILPLRELARNFRKAIHNLALFKPQDAARPDWQDVFFLGKPLRKQGALLVNAEQLDQRGLSCDVEDYINDQEVFPGMPTCSCQRSFQASRLPWASWAPSS